MVAEVRWSRRSDGRGGQMVSYVRWSRRSDRWSRRSNGPLGEAIPRKKSAPIWKLSKLPCTPALLDTLTKKCNFC